MDRITATYRTHAENFPNKVAIQTMDESLCYRDWYERVEKTASWFNGFNTSNQIVGVLMPNGIPFLQLFAGAAAAGWIAVPFDIKWREEEIQKRLALSSPFVLLTTKELYERVKHLHPNIQVWEPSCLEKVSEIDRVGQADSGDIPFYLGFTSGSTGEPKAFIRSHQSWIASFECNLYDFHIDANDHVLIPGALIHSHFLYGAISTLYLGGTVYVLEKFSVPQTLSILEAEPISVVYFVPTMIEALLREEEVIERPVKIISSGAKWEVDSKRRIPEVFRDVSMYEFYGASELSFVTFLSHTENQLKPNSVGKPFHNVEIQIRTSNGDVAETNEIGKIHIRSEMVFIGYLHPQNRTIRSIHDAEGWVTVDDMGYIDEEGYLYIAGREKNMILYGGINIFPEEVEAVLSQHRDVEYVAVVGMADSYWGQMVAAVIVGTAPKLELKRLCKQHLAAYKVPRKWFFIEEMPLTVSGKIARAQVQEWIEGKEDLLLERQ
ncbi:AMP-binding protein [Peribacillus asahii]|uniref:AMP-binding protein n=1 Tax=Peribacillus asahii TaxID=228899 RepID=UPI002079FAB8|nr:AMP-binding protein [Peribacillus asahii]USK60077.1 AMP-binding protein [Peribacillus asahii]